MKSSNKVLLFSVILIIFLAGCTTGGESPVSSNGVIIESFAPDLSTVDSGTPVNFILSIKNVGGKPADNVYGVLFGLSDKWNLNPALDTLTLISSSLAPADQTTGLPGEEATHVWTVDAVPSSQTDITYDATVRIQYKYKTEATGLVRIVSSDYLRTNPNVPRGVTESQTTAGPLVVNFFARSPLVTPTNNKVRVQIEVQNVGGGKTFVGEPSIDPSKQVTSNMLNKIKVSVGDDPANFCDTSVEDKEVLLIGGKSAIINCEKTVETNTFTDITFPVTIKYGYFVESATQVTVLKALS